MQNEIKSASGGGEENGFDSSRQARTIDETKPFYNRWWFWLIAIMIIGGLFILFMSNATSDDRKKSEEKQKQGQEIIPPSKEFSSDQLKAAEAAFANGITVNDDKDDFMVGAEGSDAAYSIPQFDAKSVSIGIDDKYIYRKCAYWQAIPKTGFSVNGKDDMNINCTVMVWIDSEQNVATKWGHGQYHMLGTNYIYLDSVHSIKLFLDLPDGATEEETNYPGNPYIVATDYGGLVSGGPGYDYYLAAWPLSKLRLQKGTAVTIAIDTEVGATGSKTHLAVDPVPHAKGQGKDGPVIKYILGQKTYRTEVRTQNN